MISYVIITFTQNDFSLSHREHMKFEYGVTMFVVQFDNFTKHSPPRSFYELCSVYIICSVDDDLLYEHFTFSKMIINAANTENRARLESFSRVINRIILCMIFDH